LTSQPISDAVPARPLPDNCHRDRVGEIQRDHR
jgi:hypothetical protein